MDIKYKDLKILFWNPRSIHQRKEELEKNLQGLDIFVCVESWLKQEQVLNFSGFNVFRKDRQHCRGGGILILIKKNILYKEITDLNIPDLNIPDSSVEIAGVSLCNITPALNLIACYRPPGSLLLQEHWDTLIKNAKRKDLPCILMGDFNAHHIKWNCSRSDINGNRLLHSIDDSDLFLHNPNSFTRIDTYRNKESNIDLILSSLSIADKINVKVLKETWGSDHYPMFVTINTEKHLYHKKTFKLHSIRTKWDKVLEHLSDTLPQYYTAEYDNAKASEKYNVFINNITEAILQNTPKKRNVNSSIYNNPVSWWDSECDELKKQRKLAYKNWKRTGTMEDLVKYKKTIAIFQRTVKKKKKLNFVQFTESLNFRTKLNYTWNNCKILKNKWAKIPTTHLSSNLPNQSELHNSLNKICPPWVSVNPTFLPASKENAFFDAPFDFTELNVALESKNEKSAPGPDGIDYSILKRLSLKHKLLLLDIFNEMYSSNDYPSSWKNSFINFIKKSDGKSYRPIALTSCVCKLFESLIKNRLQWFCEHNKLLPASQSGFRKGQSCNDNLTNLILYIEDGFKDKKDTLACFLDVKGAFDNVLWDILLKILADIGCSKNTLVFVKFLIYERSAITNFTHNETRLIHKGVPQGGVLSPLLYTLYVSNVTNSIPKQIQCSQFADDLAFYCKIKPFNRCKNLIEKSILIVKNSLLALGLDLEDKKTVLIHFNKKHILPGSTEVRVGEVLIKSSQVVRFLGVYFDYQLNFSSQINHIEKKCLVANNIIKFLCRTWWGSDPETLITIYKSMIRSLIDYGLFIYFPTLKSSTKKLEKIQISALRTALGYRRSTPTNIILEESKCPSIQERASFLCKAYLSKVLSNKNLPTKKSVLQFYFKNKPRKLKRKRLIHRNIEYIANRINKKLYTNDHYDIYSTEYNIQNICIPHNTEIGERLKKCQSNVNNLFDVMVSNENNTIIYTDGSKVSNAVSVGSACICNNPTKEIRNSLPPEASIYTAEIVAIYNAFDLALKNPKRNYKIVTDSLSTVTCLSKPCSSTITNPYILKIKSKYAEFLNITPNNSNIEIIWVPSHIGITGNETADALAKRSTLTLPNDNLLIPFTDFKHIYKHDMVSNSRICNENQGLSKGKHYFTYMHTPTNKPWFFNAHLSRKVIVMINRARANHYNLKASLARVNIISDPTCECGADAQDLNHILWQCSQYESQRLILIQNLIKIKLYPPYDVNAFLALCDNKVVKHICIFIEKCNLSI